MTARTWLHRLLLWLQAKDDDGQRYRVGDAVAHYGDDPLDPSGEIRELFWAPDGRPWALIAWPGDEDHEPTENAHPLADLYHR